MRYRKYRHRIALGQEKEFVPMIPVPEKKIGLGIPGVLLIAAAFFVFLPHGIFGKRR